ncbi:MAG: thiamine-phosphate kinase [Candidatus Hydrogenedentes bacterium]|nr:thiamine-phosphate kinase [Candidatus Hydrogenedentota bacterium]
MTTLGDLGEFGFIDRLAKALPADPNVELGIGDDCAVIDLGGTPWLVTTDMALEDVHFRWGAADSASIGWKVAASNLSDIAAMGGVPRFALVSVAAPPETDVAELEAVYQGISELLQQHGACIVGGDTARAVEGCVIDLTLIGALHEGRYLSRSGARPGDCLMMTGFPGRAAGGLHAQENGIDAPTLLAAHHRPVPRVNEGQWLCNQAAVHAMIDISDGVAQDAGHVADASGLGVDIHTKSLPVDSDLARYATAQGLDVQVLMLGGGEEYELALAVEPGAAEELAATFQKTFALPLTAIGAFSDAFQGVRVDGTPSDASGFDHFRG